MSTVAQELENPSLMVEVDETEDGDISGFDPMDYGDQQPEPAPIGDVAQEYWTEKDADNLNEPEPEQSAAPTPRAGARGADNAVQARLRIAEREAREGRIYRERLDYLLAKLTEQQNQQPEEEEEEIPPYEEDPLYHSAKKIDRLEKKLDHQAEQARIAEQRQQIGQLLSQADEYTNAAIAEVGPDIWNAAMTHLASVRIDDYVERNPQYTRDEASKIIGAAIVKEKVRMVAEGRNPAEVYLRDAVRFGFHPKGMTRGQAPAQPKVSPAKNEIARANTRDKVGGKTIASVSGAPAKARLSATSTLGMDDRLFREIADDAIKEKGGKLSMRDFISPN